MQEMEKKYRAAGMNDEQITAMREYEEEQFRRERIYKIHIVLEQSKEYPGLIKWSGTEDRPYYCARWQRSCCRLLPRLD